MSKSLAKYVKKDKKKKESRPVLHIVTYDPRIFRDGTCQDGEQYEEAGLTTGLEIENANRQRS